MSSSSSSSSSAALLLPYHIGSFLQGGAVGSSTSIAGSTEPITSVLVHPLVLLSVLDHHTRRAEGAGRVIGTLLGRRDGDKVEITNCFAVPHAERGDEVAIGKDFNRQMLALHLRSNRRETVVGWYATALPDDNNNNNTTSNTSDGSTNSSSGGSGAFRCIADTSSLIHEFYAGECDDEDPVHLVIDTSLITDAIGLRAYKCTPVQVRGEPLGNIFHEIPLSMKTTEPERISLHRMIQAQTKSNNNNTPSNEEEQVASLPALQVSMEKLLQMLEQTSDYVDDVIQGKKPPNDKVGRIISDTLSSSIPRIRPDIFNRMFHDTLQDLLMVTYLSNVTRTQISIAEKLNATLHI